MDNALLERARQEFADQLDDYMDEWEASLRGSGDDHESFAESWTRTTDGPRGGERWQSKSGKIVYSHGDPGAKGGAGVVNRVDEAVAHPDAREVLEYALAPNHGIRELQAGAKQLGVDHTGTIHDVSRRLAEHAHAKAKEGKEAAPAAPQTQPASPSPDAHKHVLDAVAALGGQYNMAPMLDVRKHMAGAGLADKAAQDAAITAAMRAGHITGSKFEGRFGITPEERAALHGSGEDELGYLHLKPAKFTEHDVADESRDAVGKWTKGSRVTVNDPWGEHHPGEYIHNGKYFQHTTLPKNIGVDEMQAVHARGGVQDVGQAATPVAPAAPKTPETARAEKAAAEPPGKRGGPGSALRGALRDAHKHLTRFTKYNDGLVDLPALYAEAKKRVPNLSPAEFRSELEAADRKEGPEGKLELQVLNETGSIADPHNVIGTRNDKQMGWAYWHGADDISRFAEAVHKFDDAFERLHPRDGGKFTAKQGAGAGDAAKKLREGAARPWGDKRTKEFAQQARHYHRRHGLAERIDQAVSEGHHGRLQGAFRDAVQHGYMTPDEAEQAWPKAEEEHSDPRIGKVDEMIADATERTKARPNDFQASRDLQGLKELRELMVQEAKDKAGDPKPPLPAPEAEKAPEKPQKQAGDPPTKTGPQSVDRKAAVLKAAGNPGPCDDWKRHELGRIAEKHDTHAAALKEAMDRHIIGPERGEAYLRNDSTGDAWYRKVLEAGYQPEPKDATPAERPPADDWGPLPAKKDKYDYTPPVLRGTDAQVKYANVVRDHKLEEAKAVRDNAVADLTAKGRLEDVEKVKDAYLHLSGKTHASDWLDVKNAHGHELLRRQYRQMHSNFGEVFPERKARRSLADVVEKLSEAVDRMQATPPAMTRKTILRDKAGRISGIVEGGA